MFCDMYLWFENTASHFHSSPRPLHVQPSAAEAAALPGLGASPPGRVAWPLLAADTPVWAEIANTGGDTLGTHSRVTSVVRGEEVGCKKQSLFPATSRGGMTPLHSYYPLPPPLLFIPALSLPPAPSWGGGRMLR